MYSPLKHFGAGNGGKRVGIIGIGGLGQMAIRLAVALGNEVTAISTSADKESKVREIGAKHFLLSTDYKTLKERAKTCDLLLNTISASHQCGKYLSLLATNGTLVQLGLVIEPHNVSNLFCELTKVGPNNLVAAKNGHMIFLKPSIKSGNNNSRVSTGQKSLVKSGF